MADGRDPAGHRRRRRGVPRVVPVLAAVLLAGQLAAAWLPSTQGAIRVLSLLTLDLLGVFFSLRASRGSRFADAWRTAAIGRALSAASLIAVIVAYRTGSASWWWTGVVAHLGMFAALSVAALVLPLRHLRGRRRTTQVAEIVTVLGGGFMLMWYLTIHPGLAGQGFGPHWLVIVGFPIGNLLLIVAVAVMPLTGTLTTRANPLTVYCAGLAVYSIAHVSWPWVNPQDGPTGVSPLASLAMVTACLLLTTAPILVCAGWSITLPGKRTPTSSWSVVLSQLPLALGCVLLLAVIARGDGRAPWAGLSGGMVIMAGGVVLRQYILARERRERLLHDPLTGLLNRSGLEVVATRALARTRRAGLLLINLDKFRIINGTYGHRTGDAVLDHFARQLQSALRPHDIAARLGSDEFVVVVIDVENDQQAGDVVDQILAINRADAVRLEGAAVRIRASIGIAFSEDDGTLQGLLRCADIAMYHARKAGDHASCRYDGAMVDRRIHDAALSDDLDAALTLGQLTVVYQPLVDLNGAGPKGAEALLRWQHPVLGAVSPVEFIGLAERSGSIVTIGLWVLEQACRQLIEWQRELPTAHPLYISVNLSPRQLQTPALVQDILTVLHRTGVSPDDLVLEITESALVEEETSIAMLTALRGHGIRIAIDDFGTGYSSLHHLAHLPADILKIDRSFVAELDGTEHGHAITQTVIRLGQVLNLCTVAEGIETAEQAAELQLLGCDTGQGYLLGRPGAGTEITAMLRSPRHSSA